jgi:hypothetical protein
MSTDNQKVKHGPKNRPQSNVSGQIHSYRQTSTSAKLRNPVIPANQTWMCTACRFVLGYTDSSKTELRMKFKDQYITIIKAVRIETTCRRCGKFNTVSATEAEPE